MSIIFHGPLEQTGSIRTLFIHSSWTWKFGWSRTLDTMRWKILFIPRISMGNVPSFQHYSMKLLLMFALSLKIPTLFTIFFLHKVMLFIIRTGVSFFLFTKFLPMKVRYWSPMLDTKYKMNLTMQLNNNVMHLFTNVPQCLQHSLRLPCMFQRTNHIWTLKNHVNTTTFCTLITSIIWPIGPQNRHITYAVVIIWR